ncbi:MAG: hypothetical protein ABI770_01270 [Sphingomicrobium sp.]
MRFPFGNEALGFARNGIAYFLKDKNENGKAIFQVKSRPGNLGDLATLNSDRLREKADSGFLICTSFPCAGSHLFPPTAKAVRLFETGEGPPGMFRLLKLKPPHGWNTVAWDLAIVTLGVLVALGAQQLVDELHWRGEVADFRNAVSTEIGNDLATYTYRKEENPCIVARLDELQHWLDGWRAGRPSKLIGPIGIPDSLVVRTGVWDSRDAGTMSHMPLSEKLGYSGLYTEFANNEVHRLDERATWIELASYDGATELDHQDLMRLQGLITRARLRLYRMTSNFGRFAKRAAALGLKPVPDPTWPATEVKICRPILAVSAA